MEVYTTQPALILYTANHLDGTLHGGGVAYGKHAGFCLETQHFPDSPNHPDFPSTVLRPGEQFRHLTIHKFSVKCRTNEEFIPFPFWRHPTVKTRSTVAWLLIAVLVIAFLPHRSLRRPSRPSVSRPA